MARKQKSKKAKGPAPAVAELPPLDVLDPNLMHSLTAIESTRDRWQWLRERGATDEQIAEALHEVYGSGGSHVGDGLDYCYRGSPRPAFYLGGDDDQPETLVGQQLVEHVRRVLAIPQPGEAAAELPETATTMTPPPSANGSAGGTTANGTPTGEALRAIAQAELEFTEAEEKCDDLKVEYREAKAIKEKKRKRLHEIVREETGLEPTLWNQQQRAQPTKAEAVQSAAIESTAAANPTATDEEVRKVRFADLGLKPGLVDKLEKAGIETLGDYYDYVKPSASGFQKRLTEIKGIGKAAVTEIENCEMDYVAELARQRAANLPEGGGEEPDEHEADEA